MDIAAHRPFDPDSEPQVVAVVHDKDGNPTGVDIYWEYDAPDAAGSPKAHLYLGCELTAQWYTLTGDPLPDAKEREHIYAQMMTLLGGTIIPKRLVQHDRG